MYINTCNARNYDENVGGKEITWRGTRRLRKMLLAFSPSRMGKGIQVAEIAWAETEAGKRATCLKNSTNTLYLGYRLLKINGVWKITLKTLVGFDFSKALNAKVWRLFNIERARGSELFEQEFKITFVVCESSSGGTSVCVC